jgi:antitoxin HicB
MVFYRYAVHLETGDEGGVVVSFPDVPCAITQGRDEADALAQAVEALGLALLSYPLRGEPLPSAAFLPAAPHLIISVKHEVAAKLAVLDTFASAGISEFELAERMGLDIKAIARILDPLHASTLSALRKAHAALKGQLVIYLK